MKIMVTGGAGYIGSVIVERLLQRGDEVVIFDNLSTGHKNSIPVSVPLVVGDVRQTEILTKALREHKIEAVIHMAAKLIVPESIEKPLDYHANNVGGTISLLEACRAVNLKHLVFSSTAATYGNPEKMPIREDDEQQPMSPYGSSKLLAERIIQESGPRQNLRSVILRYFNVAGAMMNMRQGQRSKDATHLIKVAAQVATGQREKLMLYGEDYPTPDGTCIRDYIHIEDLAEAHLKALEYLVAGGASEVFNCGYGQGLSVLQVVQAVEKILGRPINKEITGRRAGDPAQLYSDSSKIRRVLRWQPQFDNIDLIVKSALDWEVHLAKNQT